MTFFFYLGWAPAPLGRLGLYVSPPRHITGLYVLDSILTLNWTTFKASVNHLILPVICMSVGSMAVMTRMTRSSMLEVLFADYIITAREKGLAERVVIWKHAWRNAMLPVITLFGLQLGSLIGGSVLIETIFSTIVKLSFIKQKNTPSI